MSVSVTQQDEFENNLYAPPVISVVVALSAALLTVGVLGSASIELAAAGAVGTVLFAFGLIRGTPRVVIGGVVGLFSCVLVAGVMAVPTGVVLFGAAGTVIAYDSGIYALRLGRQTTTEASTWRAESLHHLASTLVIAGTAGIGVGLFLTGPGNLPADALFLLVLSAGLLLWVVQTAD